MKKVIIAYIVSSIFLSLVLISFDILIIAGGALSAMSMSRPPFLDMFPFNLGIIQLILVPQLVIIPLFLWYLIANQKSGGKKPDYSKGRFKRILIYILIGIALLVVYQKFIF